MSSRARRVGAGAEVTRFDWGADDHAAPARPPLVNHAARVAATAPHGEGGEAVDAAAIERDAFTKGYAQGERAGAEAAAARADAMLKRLAQTIEELQALRGEVIRRTERQVVELAVAIARRVVLREVSLDPELLLALARVALDRLSDTATASIHLHPEDHAAAMAPRSGAARPAGVQIVADASVRRGGCVVRSEFGSIDVAVGAQLDEITRALLGDAAGEAPADDHALARR